MHNRPGTSSPSIINSLSNRFVIFLTATRCGYNAPMHVVIFEGGYWDIFAPLTINRPAFTLLCGASTLVEKHIRWLRPSRLSLWVRPQLIEYCNQFVLPKLKVPTTVNQPLDEEPALIVSGRSVYLSPPDIPDTECIVLDDVGRLIKSRSREE